MKITLSLFFLSFINAQIALPTFQAVHTPHTAEAESGSQTFSYAGAQQTFTVPSGVNSISVDAYGAEGGKGQRGYSLSEYPGKGGRVQVTISTTPGEVLYIYIGGVGSDATIDGGGSAGWNGGGTGASWGSAWGGGGGGGATDIRRSGTELTNRILVVGAGGGNGCNYGYGDAGGDGGGTTGEDANTATGHPNNSYKGTGGTQSAGGTYYGTLGIGGNGHGTTTGGAGGGGYYGGGGGKWQGAGGGSSWVTTSGSSSITHTQGSRSGNGTMIISW